MESGIICHYAQGASNKKVALSATTWQKESLGGVQPTEAWCDETRRLTIPAFNSAECLERQQGFVAPRLESRGFLRLLGCSRQEAATGRLKRRSSRALTRRSVHPAHECSSGGRFQAKRTEPAGVTACLMNGLANRREPEAPYHTLVILKRTRPDQPSWG